MSRTLALAIAFSVMTMAAFAVLGDHSMRIALEPGSFDIQVTASLPGVAHKVSLLPSLR